MKKEGRRKKKEQKSKKKKERGAQNSNCTQEALRQSEERWQLALIGSNEGIWDHNLVTNEHFLSARCLEIVGYDFEEIDSFDKWLTYIHPDDAVLLQEKFQQHLAKQTQHYSCEYRMRCKDGNYKWLLARGQALWDDAGKPIRAVGSISDINERKQFEEELKQAKLELEQRVAERTLELSKTNERLQQELNIRLYIENALRESEEKFRQIAENSQHVVWVSDAFSYKVIYINPIYELVWGRKCEDLYRNNTNWIEAIHLDDRSRVQQALQEKMHLGLYDEEYRIVRSDASIRWIRDRGFPIKNAEGKVYRIAGIAEDITERKQEETITLKRQQEFIALVENSPDIIVRLDRELRHLYINPAIEKETGIPWQKFIGKTIYEMGLPTEVVTTFEQGARYVMQTGKEHVIEFSLPTTSGVKIFQSRLVPETTRNGVIESSLGVTRDITPLRVAEMALRQNEMEFRSLSENSPIGIFRMDTEGHCTYTNYYYQVMCDCTFEEALGDGWLNILHPEDRARVLTQWSTSLSDKQKYINEMRYIRKDGSIRYCLVQAVPISGSSGELMGYVGIVEDITESRAITKMKNEFISVVSHELRTPLTSLRASLALLANGVYDKKPEKGKRMLQVAAESSARLVRLVSDILDLERLESGKVKLLMESCDTASLMQQSVEAMRANAEENEITIKVNPINMQVWAAPDAIIQTITNLLSNAVKFSEVGSTIWLNAELRQEDPEIKQQTTQNICKADASHIAKATQTRQRPLTETKLKATHILFSVKDGGRGIPSDKLERVFGQFQQVDASDSRQKGGTGLGLAICRSIIGQHSGQIWAESILGEGSTFYFTLPVVPNT
jgi:PAS domain S-box-containing protein